MQYKINNKVVDISLIVCYSIITEDEKNDKI